MYIIAELQHFKKCTYVDDVGYVRADVVLKKFRHNKKKARYSTCMRGKPSNSITVSLYLSIFTV